MSLLTRRNTLGTLPIDDFVSRVFRDMTPWTMPAIDEEEGNLALDISESDKEVVVRASMPGFKKDDIDVQINNGVLTIKAEHVEEKEEKDKRYYRKERRVGSLNRRVALPSQVLEDKAKAELRDGVLELHIPRAEHPSPRRVPIS